MLHVVARTVSHRLLFTTWAEGLEVFDLLVARVPELHALCVMPDHLHVLAPVDVRARVGRALGGLARRRNHREGRGGALVQPLPRAVAVSGASKQRRSVRYVHLNPCRAGLVDDPLAWPLSTHRDAVGLTWPPVGPRRHTGRFDAYVSGDPTAQVAGTPLPLEVNRVEALDDVLRAVSVVTGVRGDRVARVAEARGLLRAAVDDLAPTSHRALARWLGVSRTTLAHSPAPPREARRMVARVAEDPRFGPLDDGWLLGLPGWERYRRREGGRRRFPPRF